MLAVGAGAAYNDGLLSLQATGVLYALSVAWAGIGCYLNGRSCGRAHCRIDGVLLPILAIAGLLNVLSVISFSWGLFWLIFVVILISSFIPEWTWRKYT